ncbi:baculoviral IAP repeat-containing protein 7 isoform X1 [Scophthalmus maximus]|uniref:baculoviral IAP repeat-containing protein 7 isoform X1 n=1 Tax=Scophthalmus maximus TaxID=52904 RepID=UPI001FA8A6A5|nr:baculoviral IAP repeat-containing protein 7 isoform X1 [Scophthalmus maximus]
MQNLEPDGAVPTPLRQATVPSYLSDYDPSRPGSQKRFHAQLPQITREAAKALFGPEPSRATKPIGQGTAPDHHLLKEQWEKMQEHLRNTSSQVPDRSSRWQQINQENAAFRHRRSQTPGLVVTLQEIKQTHVDLHQQLENLVTDIRDPLKPTIRQTASRPHLPDNPGQERYHSTPAQIQYTGQPVGRRETYFSPPGPGDMLAEDFSHLRVSHWVEGERSYPQYYSVPPRASNSFVDQHGQRTQPLPHEPHYGYTGRAEGGYAPYRTLSEDPAFTQVHSCRVSKPSIPHLTMPDPKQFSRMKFALENILPNDATERFKFKILKDHLRCEEALIVADSYRDSWQPYTDTMLALTKMYGQPHKLALQRIIELMDGPDIHSGDLKAFRLLALRVRSLVGMLEQLGMRGQVELHCGSNVSRLLGKLPHDLIASFKRFIHPMRVAISTLKDLAEWLEYELEMQEDRVKGAGYRREESSNRKKENRTALLGTGKAGETSTPATLLASEPSVNHHKPEMRQGPSAGNVRTKTPLRGKVKDPSPEELLRQLQEERTCKVCMDKLVSIVFIPCGHLVVCGDCAASLRHCPICRAVIRGSVRAFMS